MKKVTIFGVLVSLVVLAGGAFLTSSFADSKDSGKVDFKAKIQECLDARKVTPQKPIEAFYCPEGGLSDEEVAYQVVLDLKFREIDKEVEKWFQELASEKSKGSTTAQTSVEIDKAFGVLSMSGFYQKYLDVCHGPVVDEVKKHFSNLTTNNGIMNVVSGAEPCVRLAASKATNYRAAAWTISTQNLVENYTSDKKAFVDQLKEKYRTVLMKMAVYTDELSRIEKKWGTVTKKQQGQ